VGRSGLLKASVGAFPGEPPNVVLRGQAMVLPGGDERGGSGGASCESWRTCQVGWTARADPSAWWLTMPIRSGLLLLPQSQAAPAGA